MIKMKSWFFKPLWIAFAVLPRGICGAVSIYPVKRQLQIALLWPNYLPLLIVRMSAVKQGGTNAP